MVFDGADFYTRDVDDVNSELLGGAHYMLLLIEFCWNHCRLTYVAGHATIVEVYYSTVRVCPWVSMALTFTLTMLMTSNLIWWVVQTTYSC